ncbi:hypothetical protein SAMN05421837_105657 [Amycolatopsis pretoriensis]|uniref:Uncharacterized protein n=1 Tax=Amycolatopsis pretoriensis TaxID=218821 RepID=A0A1H5R108_9PSEU|nr:hypothetical protein SAMN05421837_105657 [Amycolatopsis pretoriensis]
MKRIGPRGGNNPFNPPGIGSRADIMPLAGSSGIGITGRMSISLILKHLVQLPERPPEVVNIPGPHGKNGPTPIPIRQNGRIPDNDDLGLGRLGMDLVENSPHLRSSGINPLGKLITPTGGQPVLTRRPGGMSSGTGGGDRDEPDVITADPEGDERGLGVDSIQLSGVGAVRSLLRRSQIGGGGPTAADISQLGGLQLRRNDVRVVVERTRTPRRRTSHPPVVRRRGVGVAQSDIPPRTTPGLGPGVRRRGRGTVLPLVVPEGQQTDDEHNDEAAAPTVLGHPSFLPVRSRFRSGRSG